MAEKREREDQQVAHQEYKPRPSPAAKVPRHSDTDQHQRRNRHRQVRTDAKVRRAKTDADKLGHDREKIEHEQVADRKQPPEATEAFSDQSGVTDAGDGSE